MKRFKIRTKYKLKNILMITLILILFFTSCFISIIGNKSSDNFYYISRNLITTITTNTVNNYIRIDLFKKYSINNLITINYQDKKIVNVDYNLESAYEILLEIKKNIIDNIPKEMKNLYNYHYSINNNLIIVEMPFYNYTDNVLIANLGPKIKIGLSMIRLIDGTVKTEIKTYGLNSLLVELYLNFTITSTIVIPYTKEKNTTNTYKVLISSKVIQGEIPSIYNGLFAQESKLITE